VPEGILELPSHSSTDYYSIVALKCPYSSTPVNIIATYLSIGDKAHNYYDTFVSIGDKMAFLCHLGITGLVIVVMGAREA